MPSEAKPRLSIEADGASSAHPHGASRADGSHRGARPTGPREQVRSAELEPHSATCGPVAVLEPTQLPPLLNRFIKAESKMPRSPSRDRKLLSRTPSNYPVPYDGKRGGT